MEIHRRNTCFHDEVDLGASSFGRTILTGYYDGPTAGFLECQGCLGIYVFQLVDWDSEQEVRVFAMGRLPEKTFDELVAELCRFFGEARWPDWFLHWIPDSQVRRIANERIAALRGGVIPQFVVAWRRKDNVILRVRRLGSDDIPDVRDWLGDWHSATYPGSRDWFQFVGLSRDAGIPRI